MSSGILGAKRIVVTRAAGQNDAFVARLRAAGAIPVELPAIRIAPPTDLRPLDAALARLARYQWLIFTSANGVLYFWRRWAAKNIGWPPGRPLRIAAIGPATRAALRQHGLTSHFMPAEQTAEALATTLPAVEGSHILFPTSDIARPTLAAGLRARGAVVEQVVVYQTRPAAPPPDLQARLAGVDVLTFTSSSTVENFIAMLRAGQGAKLPESVVIACIGPKTARTARHLGLRVDITAPEHTVPGLVAALENYYLSQEVLK